VLARTVHAHAGPCNVVDRAQPFYFGSR
jgi:hypothetical protein